MVIFNTYPFLASVLGYFINGEKFMKMEIIAIIFCFTGVVFFGIGKAYKEVDQEKKY